MIPKIIHYCWFGQKPLTPLAKRCIKSWKKHLSEYELKEWNEDNFDINFNQYVKEAYEAKKWAFVSDFVRLYALYNFGGIYMDTDVEVLKSFDCFLGEKAFSGFENEKQIPTAVMGSEKNNRWITILLNYYKDRTFVQPDGSYDLTTNVVTITNLTSRYYKIRFDNTYQRLADGVVLYPKEYFCPVDMIWKVNEISSSTYAIHHFAGSWLKPKERCVNSFKKCIYKNLGSSFVNRVRSTFENKKEHL